MKTRNDKRHILLAITEASSLPDLWRAVIEHLAGDIGELTTVYVTDDRWHRAASLPFTREVCRVSGDSENFTPQRAQQIDEDTVGRTHRELQKLATEAELQCAFKVLPEHDAARLKEIVSVEYDVLIVPSFLKDRPIYTELTRMKCRILYVDTEDEQTGETEE